MSSSRWAAFLFLVLASMTAAPAAGADTASGDRVLIREADVITEDLYSSGNSVVIRGRIQGDLVATAFESIVVEGVVEGDVIALTTRIEITGRVDGSVRGVADQVVIDGRVGEDVVVAARTMRASGDVGRDILAFAYALETATDSTVGGDIRIQVVDRVHLAGRVNGDAEVNADRLLVADGAVVGGDLRYRADATIGDVQVDGVSIELGRVPTPLRVRTLLLLSALLATLVISLLTLLAFSVAPLSVRHATAALSGWRWLRALSMGLAVVVVPPAAFVALAVGAAVSSPDLVLVVAIVLVPFVAMWLAALAAALVVGVAPIALALGRRIVPGRTLFLQVLIGLVVVGVGVLLPTIGPWVAALAWVTGLGAWALGIGRTRRSSPRLAAPPIPSR